MELMNRCKEDPEYLAMLLAMKNLINMIYKLELEECESCKYFEENENDNEDLACTCKEKHTMYNDSLSNLMFALVEREEAYENEDKQEAL